jgi:uncharacterized protein (UPF0261 family)
MRTTADENAELGRRDGAKLAAATSPTVLIVPRGGVSALDAPGMPFADAVADQALFDAVLETVAGSDVIVTDAQENINDSAVAVNAAEQLHALIQGSRITEGN